jgi:hypothetical protein
MIGGGVEYGKSEPAIETLYLKSVAIALNFFLKVEKLLNGLYLRCSAMCYCPKNGYTLIIGLR